MSKSKNRGLTAAFVKAVRQPGKYYDGMGTGLFLLVKPTGARFWMQRLTLRCKRRELGLGSPLVVTLAQAREAALENKRLVYAGGDPLAERRKAKAVLTFEEAARAAHIELSPTWKNSKDSAAFIKTLETYIFPRFGSIPLGEVTSADIRRAIMDAREKASEVAKKLIYRVSSVFKWGIAEGRCIDNPATAQALALPRENRTVQHRKALPYAQVAGCIDTVRASQAWPATKLALEFAILTACRSIEIRAACWCEFDFHGAQNAAQSESPAWEMPVERMKMKRIHRVPLSRRAIEILTEAETLADGSGLVFPSMRGKILSDATLSKLVRELGFDATVHGFRTSFRTWAQEQTNFPREVAEMALAHKVGNAVEAAYARSDLFEKRRKMMESWAGYLQARRGEVVRLA